MRSIKFKIHIAIDFGTDGCGLAFAYKNQVTAYEKFKGRKSQRTTKTKTQILLNAHNVVSNFGNNAKSSYLNLEGGERLTWKYFERFKMALYEKDIPQISLFEADDEKQSDKVDISNILSSANGQTLPSEVVFVEAFKRLEKMAKAFMPKITKDHINNEEIQWIVTVPAIWSEPAKDKMKKWIIKSGLVDECIRDQCLIVYEPDCASLALRKEYLNKTIRIRKDYVADPQIIPAFSEPIKEAIISNVTDDAFEDMDELHFGDRYILIDAGGGTVDIACHGVRDDGFVEEIIRPTGNKWGSCYIDDLYIKLLKKIFTDEWIDEFKNEEPTLYLDVVSNFQDSKLTFYENSKAVTHAVELPFEFVQFLEEKCDVSTSPQSPEKMINSFAANTRWFREFLGAGYHVQSFECRDRERKRCTLQLVTPINKNRKYHTDEKYLEMDVEIWKALFDSQIDQIVSHVNHLLHEPELYNQCDYLGLVGGFSGSKYFQERIKNKFGKKEKPRLVIPEKPILAVVRGAAWMAIIRNYVQARKLPCTYGIQMRFSKQRAKKCGISDRYIKNNTNKYADVSHCFSIIAHKDERVTIGEVKEERGYGRSNKSLIPILCSDQDDPKTYQDGYQLGNLTIPHFNNDKEVIIEFHFYGTTFKVEAYPKSYKAGKQTIEIEYKPYRIM